MPRDYRLYVRDLALAATLIIGAVGWNSAADAQSSERFSKYENSVVRLGPIVAQAVAGSCYQRRCSYMGARRGSGRLR